ncbi:unnamed protein product, partial [Ectocarpus sp. 12 AP-2014]
MSAKTIQTVSCVCVKAVSSTRSCVGPLQRACNKLSLSPLIVRVLTREAHSRADNSSITRGLQLLALSCSHTSLSCLPSLMHFFVAPFPDVTAHSHNLFTFDPLRALPIVSLPNFLGDKCAAAQGKPASFAALVSQSSLCSYQHPLWLSSRCLSVRPSIEAKRMAASFTVRWLTRCRTPSP